MLEKYRIWQKPVMEKKKGKMRFMAIWFSRCVYKYTIFMDPI